MPLSGSPNVRDFGRARWTCTDGCSGSTSTPYLGGVPVGKMSARLVREWRAALLGNGVSVSVAAKAYRLLRAIMTTAVDEDNMLPRNPCRIKGAGDEDAAERPVLTVRQVFDLAERVGRRPVGNIRKVPDGYRLRFSRNGEMRTSPERYATQAGSRAGAVEDGRRWSRRLHA